jgi:hypothetical protein
MPADAAVAQNPAEPFHVPTTEFWIADKKIESAAALSRPSTPGSKARSKVGKSSSQPAMTGPHVNSVIATDEDAGDRPHLAQPNLILAEDPKSPQSLSMLRTKAKSEGDERERVFINRFS